MNFTGLYVGLFTFLSIGLGFVWVIKVERRFGSRPAKIIGLFGFLTVFSSLFIPNFELSALVGVLGGTIIWGATELPEQELRARERLKQEAQNEVTK